MAEDIGQFRLSGIHRKGSMMKVLGISGSPRKEGTSGVYKLVKTVVEKTGCDHEIVSLRGKQISGCIACLGCAKDNTCKVKDDLEPLREKLVEADALVIGAPNYFSNLNAQTHAVTVHGNDPCRLAGRWSSLTAKAAAGTVKSPF